MFATILILLISIYVSLMIYKHPETLIQLRDKYKLKCSSNKMKSPIYDTADMDNFKNCKDNLKKRAKIGILYLGAMVTFLILTTIVHIIKWSF